MTAKEAYNLVMEKSKGTAEVGVCIDLGWLGYVFSYSKDPDAPDPFVRVDKKSGKMTPFVPMEYADEVESAINKGNIYTDMNKLP